MGILKSVRRTLLGPNHKQRTDRFRARLSNFGLSRFCPCCQSYVAAFLPHGLIKRPQARCPICRSLERHRLIRLYFANKTNLLDGRPKKLLHVAPEIELSQWLQNVPNIDYLSADLMSPRAMVKMDITDIQYPDASFDVVYCSHVLEHVSDDRQAMREFFRVLKPGGWGILQVPVTAPVTFEDPTVTSPEERTRLFGQHDHVRRYGPDYVDRLRDAGFDVHADKYPATMGDWKRNRFGIRKDDAVYYCRKAA